MRVLLLLMLLYLCESFISAALFHSLPPRLTKVCTAAPPRGGWGSAAVPSSAGGLSQVVDAYFYSNYGCLGFSELLLYYNMTSDDCADFCAPYQVHEQDLSSSTILESHGYQVGPFGCLHPSQFFH